jgi:hypothetical protein
MVMKKKETNKIKDKSSDDEHQLNFLKFLLAKIQNVVLMNLSWYEILFILVTLWTRNSMLEKKVLKIKLMIDYQ